MLWHSIDWFSKSQCVMRHRLETCSCTSDDIAWSILFCLSTYKARILPNNPISISTLINIVHYQNRFSIIRRNRKHLYVDYKFMKYFIHLLWEWYTIISLKVRRYTIIIHFFIQILHRMFAGSRVNISMRSIDNWCLIWTCKCIKCDNIFWLRVILEFICIISRQTKSISMHKLNSVYCYNTKCLAFSNTMFCVENLFSVNYAFYLFTCCNKYVR